MCNNNVLSDTDAFSPDPSGSSKETIVSVIRHLTRPEAYDNRVRPVAMAEDTLEVTMELQLKSMFYVRPGCLDT